MLTIEIWNYKTIEHMRMSFEGFATIQGRNFIGKSAVLGAVRSCLTNTIDKSAVRRGSDFVDVRVIHDHSDLDCFWHYEEGNTYYLINKQEYIKLNGAVPPPLLERGFGAVAAGDEQLHYWDVKQFKSLFLVDKGRSAFATDILSTIFNIDSIYKAKDLCDRDLKESRAQLKMRKGDLSKSEEALSALSDVPHRKKGVDSLGERIAELAKERAKTARLSSLSAESKEISKALAIGPILGSLVSPKAPQSATLQQALRLLSSLKQGKAEITKLFPVSTLTKVSRSQPVLESSKSFVKATSLLQELKSSAQAVRGLRKVDEVPAPKGAPQPSQLGKLRGLVDSSRQASATVEALEGVKDCKVLTSPPDGAKPSAMKALFAELKMASKQYRALSSLTSVKSPGDPPETIIVAASKSLKAYKDCSGEVASLGIELEKAREEAQSIKEKLESFGSCPLCGHALHEGNHE